MKYLAAFRYAVNAILKGVDIMLTVNINGKKESLWGTLASTRPRLVIVLAIRENRLQAMRQIPQAVPVSRGQSTLHGGRLVPSFSKPYD